jgi:hypothetical protein
VSINLRGTDAVEGMNFNPQPVYQCVYDVDGYFYIEAEVPASTSAAVVRVVINSTSGGAGSVSVGEFSIRPIGGSELSATRAKRTRGGKVRSVVGSYTMTVDDEILLVDATGGPVTITLPNPGINLYGYGAYTSSYQIPVPGQTLRYTVVKTDSTSNAVTVSAPSSTTIDGVGSISLASRYSKAQLLAAKTGLFLRMT